MPASELQRIKSVEREVEVLLREFRNDVRRHMIGGKDASGRIPHWDARRKALDQKLRRLHREYVRYLPGKTVEDDSPYSRLRRHLNEEFQRIASFVRKAHDRSLRVDSGVKGAYNRVVSRGLYQLADVDVDTQARKAVEKGILQLVDKHVSSDVPADVRRRLARALADQVVKIPALQDAFFAAESLIITVARYLDDNITFHKEVRQVRVTLEGRTIKGEELPSFERTLSETVDKRLTPAARRAAGARKTLRSDAEKSQLKVKKIARLKVKPVLDKAVWFVEKVDGELGVQITGDGYRITFNNQFRIERPLVDSRTLGLHTYGRIDFNSNQTHLQIGYRAQSSFRQLGDMGKGTVYGRLDHRIGNRTSLSFGVEHDLRRHETRGFFGLKISF